MEARSSLLRKYKMPAICLFPLSTQTIPTSLQREQRTDNEQRKKIVQSDPTTSPSAITSTRQWGDSWPKHCNGTIPAALATMELSIEHHLKEDRTSVFEDNLWIIDAKLREVEAEYAARNVALKGLQREWAGENIDIFVRNIETDIGNLLTKKAVLFVDATN
jgi:hypothetical protein